MKCRGSIQNQYIRPAHAPNGQLTLAVVCSLCGAWLVKDEAEVNDVHEWGHSSEGGHYIKEKFYGKPFRGNQDQGGAENLPRHEDAP